MPTEMKPDIKKLSLYVYLVGGGDPPRSATSEARSALRREGFMAIGGPPEFGNHPRPRNGIPVIFTSIVL